MTMQIQSVGSAFCIVHELCRMYLHNTGIKSSANSQGDALNVLECMYKIQFFFVLGKCLQLLIYREQVKERWQVKEW